MINDQTLETYLQNYFHFSSFRQGQKEIIQDVLDGKDVLGILPTGSGKSLCYQLPAKLLSGITIVVSPLISLMIDQVKQLKAINFKEVVALNSFMPHAKRALVYNNMSRYKLIYVSPEILQQEVLHHQLSKEKISLFVIDEAHCISQWGHEFRPDYLRLTNIISLLNHPPVLALSATATKDVQKDILHALKRPYMKKHVYPMDRPNIVFDVQKVSTDLEKIEHIKKILANKRLPTLIYFSSRQATEYVADLLAKELPHQRISYYHGGMEQIDRVTIQQQFMNDQLDIICCTSAFGMGINKDNIRLIIHFHFPPQLEDFIQEIGRAGRDGQTSVSLLFYSGQDEYLPYRMIHIELPTNEQITYVFQILQSLIKQHKQLPKNTEDIETIFQCQDIQWRFLYYQLEKHGIVKNRRIIYDKARWQSALEQIQLQRNERFKLKENKLKDILAWIHSKQCLRQSLYRHFQDTFTKPQHECCSYCGFSFAHWNPSNDPKAVEYTHTSWEYQLKDLLLIGDRYETKRTY